MSGDWWWWGEGSTPPPPALTVTINKAAAQADPTAASPILFDVVFSEAVTGFATGDITLSGTGGATTAVVSGTGPAYTVTVTGMTGTGIVIASIAAGVCTATASGLPNEASTSTDNSVQYNDPAHVGYKNLGAASATGFDGATCSILSGVTGTRTFRVMCTGGRRDANPGNPGNLYKGPTGQDFLEAAANVGTGQMTGRVKASGNTITTAITTTQTMQNFGIGAGEAMYNICAVMIATGYSIKQIKVAGPITSTSPAVTFDSPVGAGGEVIVCLHHLVNGNPVSAAPANSSLLASATVLDISGGNPCGLRLYAINLASMVGQTVVPGLTMTSGVWIYQAIEIGP